MFNTVEITAWVVAPNVVYVSIRFPRSGTGILTVTPPDVGAWLAQVRRVFGTTAMVGQSVVIESGPTGEIVRLWRGQGFVPVAFHRAVPPVPVPTYSPELVSDALAHINLHRARAGQRPLIFGPVTWLAHTPPTEPWSDDDIVREARALGWRQ